MELEDGVFDREADVAVGFGEAADGFGFVDAGFEHHEGDGNAASCALDRVDRSLAADAAGAHENANAALYQLGVLHVDVHHQVLVDVAQPRHGASGDHVEHHLLRGARLHAGGTGDDFGADFGDDGDVSGGGEGGVVVAGDGCGSGSAGPGIGDCGDYVRGAS